MSAHGFDAHGQVQCPMMPTYGPPPVMFVRGKGINVREK